MIRRHNPSLRGTLTPGRPRTTPATWADFGLTPEDLAWHEHAACRGTDPDAFFPEPGPGAAELTAAAKRVCAVCPVRAACAEWASTHDEEFGIWGGQTEQERPRRHRRPQTPRDREVARLTRAGKTAREIACTLRITPRTVVRVRARLRADQDAA
ncbi:WhiB family transcriptional regulator [Amycolatopsis methanolica]|uniref:Transcriptional regulator WhiB n=1 Tax=Amycolatopsis methanolica 239 TaxID=1068978 RepID=A0A076MPA6_AMYME|nr:WhiB family transcriptional regulator [Amycolatopsis methanolica]AIJ20650.1 WhiB-type transcription regulator [Amycolatopsis methanolica 239]